MSTELNENFENRTSTFLDSQAAPDGKSKQSLILILPSARRSAAGGDRGTE